MPKSLQTLAYVLPVLAVLAFLLTWKFFISPDPIETSPDHQARLSTTAANVFAPAETSEDELRIYAVYIVRKVPFKSPFIGYGIYLGQGTILTAAHAVRISESPERSRDFFWTFVHWLAFEAAYQVATASSWAS